MVIGNMEIRVDSLKDTTNKLNHLIEDYEAIYLNFYNQISFATSFWNDSHSVAYFQEIERQKLKIKTTIQEMKDVKDVYTYLFQKYQNLGNKIVCYLDKQDETIHSFNQYIEKLNFIIQLYNNLNLSFCTREARCIRSERSRLIAMRNKMETVRDETKKTFNTIREIEHEVNYRISKITIEVMKEMDIRPFI